MLFYFHHLLFFSLAFSSAVSFSVYMIRRDKLYFYAALYLLLSMILELIVYDSEISGSVSVFLRKELGNARVIISICYFFCTVVITFLVEDITSFRIGPLSFLPSIAVFIWFVIVESLPNSPVQGWLYILPYQLFSAGFSLYAIAKLKRFNATDKIEYILFRITFIFSIIIFAEDSFFSFVIPLNKKRSYSEGILWMVYSVLLISRSFKILTSLQSSPYVTAETAGVQDQAGLAPFPSRETDKLYCFSASINLTAREMELLPLLLDNRSYQEISELLFISVGTVKAHNHSIYYKADVKNRSELINCFNSFQKS